MAPILAASPPGSEVMEDFLDASQSLDSSMNPDVLLELLLLPPSVNISVTGVLTARETRRNFFAPRIPLELWAASKP